MSPICHSKPRVLRPDAPQHRKQPLPAAVLPLKTIGVDCDAWAARFAIAVAPLVLALVWEHVKGVKLGKVEITLAEVAPALHVQLASQI